MKGKIRLVWIMPLILGALIAIFMVVSPILISGAIEKFHVKLRAEETIENLTGGTANIGTLSAALFPIPHIVINNSRVKIPGRLDLKVDKVEIYPRIFYLLQGKMLLSSLNLKGADASVVVVHSKKKGKPVNLKSIKIPTIWFALPPLNSLSLERCKVSLYSPKKDKPFLVIHPLNLKASLNHNRLNLKLRLKTGYSEEVYLKGKGDLLLNNADAKVEITNLRPHLWLKELLPHPPKGFKKGTFNFIGHLKKRGSDILAQGTASIPMLTFKTKETTKEVSLSLPKAQGTWEGNKKGWTLNLKEIHLQYPPAKMGITVVKRKKEASIVLRAAQLDLGALRTWLKQVPPVYHYLHNLFDIVHQGTARNLTVGFHGKSFKEISNIRRLSVDGEVEHALVMIPKVKLPVREVRGTVHMENATIVGSNLEGLFASSTKVSNGKFSLLSLKVKKNHMHPFHISLDAYGNNTIADLLPVLKRLIHNREILKELNRIDAQCSARLHLYLGDYLEALHADARVEELKGVVNYKAIPFPVHFLKGSGRYHNSTIEWQGIEASLGNTTVSHFSGSLSPLSGNPTLQIRELKGSLEMQEIRYWLQRYPVLHPYTVIFPSIEGRLEVKSCRLKGPLTKPEKWRFNLMATPQDLNFSFTLVPFPVTLMGGTLTFTERLLKMDRVAATGGMSKMKVSGWLKDYIGKPTAAEVRYSGTMGGPLYNFIVQLSETPKSLWLKTPFETTGAWSWKGGLTHTLKGKAFWSSGEKATVDLTSSKEGIFVKNASLMARGTRCDSTITIPFDNIEPIEISFEGRLNYRDVENVFLDHGFLVEGGFIEGKGFFASVDLKRPKRSLMKGWLKMKNIKTDGYLIKNFEAEGTPKGLTLNNLTFMYGEEEFKAKLNLILSTPLNLTGIIQGSVLRIPHQKAEVKAQKGRPTGKTQEEKPRRTVHWERYLESIEGTLTLNIGKIEYGNYTIDHFLGTFNILGERAGVEVDMRKGEVCTIPVTGRVKLPIRNRGQSTYEIRIPKRKLSEEEQPRFEKVIPCLFPELKGKALIEGPFRVWGDIKGRDSGDHEVLKRLHGYLKVKSNPKKELGIIHKFNLVSKLLNVLNPLDMAQNLTKITVDGIPFTKLIVSLKFEGETWPIEEMALDGPALKIVATGKLKKTGTEIDATILVGMLKTVSRIIKNIPLVKTVVKHVLGGKHGSIISIPVQVSGPINDPLVVPMSPTTVGSEVFGIVKRTLGLPVKLLSPLIPSEKIEDNKTQHER